MTIGDQSTAQGRLIVDGDDASLEGADMTVGNDGKGLLSIGNGNDVTTDGDATIGANADGTGSVLVGDGTGTGAADWEISGTLTDGGAGKGVLTVADSDLSVGGDFVIGDQAGSNGQATFTAGSLSMDGGTITVGNQGKGSLLFQTGSTLAPGDDLNVPSVIIGEVLGASGTMTVTDAGTSVEIDDLTVGDAGTGSLKVAAGGQLQVDGTADIGAGVVGAIQNLTLDTQGLMSVVGDLSLGEAGIVAVNVKNGAQLAGDSNVTLGEDAGSSAAVTVTGVFTPESGFSDALGPRLWPDAYGWRRRDRQSHHQFGGAGRADTGRRRRNRCRRAGAEPGHGDAVGHRIAIAGYDTLSRRYRRRRRRPRQDERGDGLDGEPFGRGSALCRRQLDAVRGDFQRGGIDD